MNQDNQTCERTCPPTQGSMPACAPLAVPYVPFQQPCDPRYSAPEGLAQGTLFQGLNLPIFLAPTGKKVPETPLSQLQALHFAVSELGLYLDTHPNDQEAFQCFQKYAAQYQRAKSEYEKAYGPLEQIAAAEDGSYTWLKDPWPWNTKEDA